jgi:exosortase B
MSTDVQPGAAALRLSTGPGRWWPLIVGLLALLLPTYLRLYESVWTQEAYEHGPIVLILFWFLVWRNRRQIFSVAAAPDAASGWPCLLLGLFVYFVGRTQNLPLFEVGAHIAILAGVLLLTLGWQSLRAAWFPLVFLLFLVPLPGFVISALTGGLKQWVSAVAESLLYRAGYPVARDGVVITVGQYQMLVADACSGLNSIYSLAAMGLLYVHLMNHKQMMRNAFLIAAIIPAALCANVIRVIFLILITFHFGDEAGQGFLHNASGIVLFVVALILLIGLDWLLGATLFRSGIRGARHGQ